MALQGALFPRDITIDSCREAVAGRREFRFTEKEDLVVCNYDFCFGGTFPDPNEETDPQKADLLKIRRECRGLIFNKNDGKVVARRLHKFFNIGESAETALDKIDFNQPHVLTEKIDGCLVSPVLMNGTIRLATKNGPTPLSALIEDYIRKEEQDSPSRPRYFEFFREWTEKEHTAIFEWVSHEEPIVLNYPKDALILIAIRNNSTGDYLTYKDMEQNALKFAIPVVPLWGKQEEIKDMRDFLTKMKEEKDIEGTVLRFDDGRMYKVKTEWYFSQSKSHIALPNNEREMWLMVLDQKLDDVYPKLSAEVRQQVDSFSQRLFAEVDRVAAEMEAEVTQRKAKHVEATGQQLTKREFVATKDSLPTFVFGITSKIFDGKNGRIAAMEVMKGACSSKSFEPMRSVFGLSAVNYFKPSLNRNER
eukprot:TRINITY_DN19552_c0_g1_i1.p1 TRINITY_DN19552_c0_g1~~TRINITY_DN19552_c0_g1_i1.p1  ORF type:complete len:420 (+),score=92.83 TRINITY_DN19552_c0_g1_i1:68-1327(+)